MPATVNGVGTHYYGKANVRTRPGVCPHCRRQVNLASYDTRLWFVVAFIPVIPLGRKRIVDACPACRRHYVVPLQKWEAAKQTEISDALEKYRTDPSPETAIAAHRQLIAFHQVAEADSVQTVMCEKYPDDATVHVYLAQTLTQLGRVREAEPLFARALQLRPDLPEARIGMAQAMIRGGRLDDARQLLDFLDRPGSGKQYPLGALETLALALQRSGRHDQALALFGRLLAELPAISNHPGFRKNVKKSEAALKRTFSILPKAKFSLKRWFGGRAPGAPPPLGRSISSATIGIIVAGVVAVVAVGLVVFNLYVRSHRTLFVANQFGPELHLEISGVGPVSLHHGINEVSLPEGHYHARISGPVREELEFDIVAGYWDRFAAKPAWVLNPDGAAILVYQEATYREDPRPGNFYYHFGRPFERFPQVDHAFTPLPKTVSLETGTTEKTLTGLQFFMGKPVNAIYALEQLKRPNETSALVEWALPRDPENEDLLTAAVDNAATARNLPRLEEFLRAGLTNRPVQIEWHRTYQQLALDGAKAASLPGLYEEMLRADPTNSSLMYLLGRVALDRARQRALFSQAHQADEKNPYPLYAMAYDQMLNGNWPEAKSLLEQVLALRPDYTLFRAQWFLTCLALGQFAEAEQDVQERLQRKPTGLEANLELCQVLAAEGKRNEGVQAINRLARLYQANSPAEGQVVARSLENLFLYALGDFAALERNGQAQEQLPAGKLALFHALLEQNRLDEAEKTFNLMEDQDPTAIAAMSLAWQLAGKADKARSWRTLLVDKLRSANAQGRRTADLLESATAPSAEALADLDESLQLKAVLVACLAQLHPVDTGRLNALARKLNVDRSFPYHLLERATAPAR